MSHFLPHPLISYPGFPALAGVKVLASLVASTEALRIRFEVKDEQNQLVQMPTTANFSSDQLLRKDNLWQNTCFEVFFSQPKDHKYWELNLSAHGQWQLYVFQDYRKPQPPMPSPDFELLSMTTTALSLEVELAPTRDASELKMLEVNFCAILKTKYGETGYYAAKHAGDRPDFHIRQSFAIQFPISADATKTDPSKPEVK